MVSETNFAGDAYTKMKNAYWYDLPPDRIASEPARPRDASKLLIYNTATNEIQIDYFYNIATHLPPSTALILNDAKVVPARVTLTKETGGKVVVLFLTNEWLPRPHGPIPCFVDRQVRVGDSLAFPNGQRVMIERQEESIFYVSWKGSVAELIAVLTTYGTMPIPPYIKNTPLSRDELMTKYQTVFAKRLGSSAAPTASLHFTENVFKKIEQKGIKKHFVTLHVGLGTFAPLTQENMIRKTLHKEWYEIPPRTYRFFEKSIQLGMKSVDVTAVGTTVVRTLESAVTRGACGDTDLFIMPPYHFRVVDHLLTNFHLPGSSLMMLVDAFLEHKRAKRRILELYDFAIKNNFRFYSFGDAMLIL